MLCNLRSEKHEIFGLAPDDSIADLLNQPSAGLETGSESLNTRIRPWPASHTYAWSRPSEVTQCESLAVETMPSTEALPADVIPYPWLIFFARTPQASEGAGKKCLSVRQPIPLPEVIRHGPLLSSDPQPADIFNCL
jgi:hypothetical protein